MKLTHEHINKCGNIGWIFLCRNVPDYMAAMENQRQFVPDAYASEKDFTEGAWALFVEAYMSFFGKKQNVFDIQFAPTASNVTLHGKDLDGVPSTVLSLYVDKDRDILMNADHLTSFFNASRLTYKVPVTATKNMFVVSNGKKVNESLMAKAPTLKDNKVRFILMDEIEQNVKDNVDFWTAFSSAMYVKKDIVIPRGKYVPRDFQIEAVETMLNNSLGQVILPTGTGKSVIQADYIKKYIQLKDGTPVIVIISPRIVLTYQLLDVVFQHLMDAKIEAQYVNLSSGDMTDVSQQMFEKMREKGMLPRDIKATTDMREIAEMAKKCAGKVPLIISATYHSGWRIQDIGVAIDSVLYDEGHNLVMGRFSDDFKKENLDIKAKNKFFFTATPCETFSVGGSGMNNDTLFGKIIYTKSYKEMIERNEILPLIVQTVDVSKCVILKNKKGPVVPENMKDSDFDRDVTSKAEAIRDGLAYHQNTLHNVSSHPESIGPKLLATIDGVAVLKGILASDAIQELRNDGYQIFAISTEIKYYRNGVYCNDYDFKEKFMRDIKALKDEDKSLILHIDMVGEGLDVSGITAVMAFSVLGHQKLMQLLGRSMRLHDNDRKDLYAGKYFKGMPRDKMMVKPYAYMIIPQFLRDSKDLHDYVSDLIRKIHSKYDFIPKVVYNESRTIGDNQNMNNTQFMGFREEYEDLKFKHDLEADALRFLAADYVVDVKL